MGSVASGRRALDAGSTPSLIFSPVKEETGLGVETHTACDPGHEEGRGLAGVALAEGLPTDPPGHPVSGLGLLRDRAAYHPLLAPSTTLTVCRTPSLGTQS